MQRIGKTGAQIGADHRVSTIGAEGDTTRETFSAPGVAADPINKRNLVVWASDHKVNSQFEVYGQLLDAAGNEIGANHFDISGENGGTYYPAVAFNPVNQQYLVVWTGTVQTTPSQWGRRFDKNGAPLGPRFQFSSPPPSQAPARCRASPTTPRPASTLWSGARSSPARTPRPTASASPPPARRSAATSGSRRPAPPRTTRRSTTRRSPTTRWPATTC